MSIYIYTFTHIICQIVTLSLKEFRARACYVRQQLGKGIMKLLGMQVVSFAQLLHYSQNAPFFFFCLQKISTIVACTQAAL